MTKFDFDGKMSIVNTYFVGNEENIKGECAKARDFMLPMQCEFQGTCQVNHKMRELHINLKTVANYLIQFFYATGRKYSCTRTKIGKLLSIIAFLYAKDDIELFDEKILKYDGCGTSIKELAPFVDEEVYFLFNYSSDNKEFIDFELDEVLFENANANHQNIPIHLKNTIKTVFKTFGSYPPSELGACINPIVEYIGFNDDDEVNLFAIRDLTRNNFNFVTENLDVINFLFDEVENEDGEEQ